MIPGREERSGTEMHKKRDKDKRREREEGHVGKELEAEE